MSSSYCKQTIIWAQNFQVPVTNKSNDREITPTYMIIHTGNTKSYLSLERDVPWAKTLLYGFPLNTSDKWSHLTD